MREIEENKDEKYLEENRAHYTNKEGAWRRERRQKKRKRKSIRKGEEKMKGRGHKMSSFEREKLEFFSS